MKGLFRTALREVAIGLRFIPRPSFIALIVPERPAPDMIRTGCIYIVGNKAYRKWAYFRCPTGSGEIIQLSLTQNRRPRWTVSIDFLSRPTITPSVRQLERTHAHFFIRKGRVEWCADSGNPQLAEPNNEGG